MQSRHCGPGRGAGSRVRPSPPAPLPALPKARAGPQRARRPLPSVSPRRSPGAVWEGNREPSEAPQTRIWEGVGRGRGFPSKLRRAWLRESFSKFPAAPAPVASAGRADGGQRARPAAASAAPAASSALWTARSREAGRAPGGQALLRGRKPQLTQAARKAEAAPLRPLGQRRGAYTWGPGERAEAPEGAVRAKGPGRPRATDTSKFFPAPSPTCSPNPGLPGAGVCAGFPDVDAVLRIPGPPFNLLVPPRTPPTQQPEGKGRDSGGHARHEY